MTAWEAMTAEQRVAHSEAIRAKRASMKHDPLLPCPFCGNAEPYRRTQYDYIGPNEGLGSGGNITREYVNCGKCGAQHQAPNPDAGHWNMRVRARPEEAWNEALREVSIVLRGWRESDWPEGFDRRTAEIFAEDMVRQLSCLTKPALTQGQNR